MAPTPPRSTWALLVLLLAPGCETVPAREPAHVADIGPGVAVVPAPPSDLGGVIVADDTTLYHLDARSTLGRAQITAADERISDMTVDTAGRIVVVGTKTGSAPWLRRYALDFTRLDTVPYPDLSPAFESRPGQLAPTPDGGVVLAEGRASSEAQLMAVHWIGDNGAVAWSYDTRESTIQVPLSLAVRGDGLVAVAGYARPNQPSSNAQRLFVTRIFPDGREEWTFRSTVNGRATAVAFTPDGGVVYAGLRVDLVSGLGNPWLGRIDGFGQGLGAEEDVDAAVSAIVVDGEDLVLAGHGGAFVVERRGPDGPRWRWRGPAGSTFAARDLTLVPGTGLVSVGSTETPSLGWVAIDEALP
jgi:hypothetical protein